MASDVATFPFTTQYSSISSSTTQKAPTLGYPIHLTACDSQYYRKSTLIFLICNFSDSLSLTRLTLPQHASHPAYVKLSLAHAFLLLGTTYTHLYALKTCYATTDSSLYTRGRGGVLELQQQIDHFIFYTVAETKSQRWRSPRITRRTSIARKSVRYNIPLNIPATVKRSYTL